MRDDHRYTGDGVTIYLHGRAKENVSCRLILSPAVKVYTVEARPKLRKRKTEKENGNRKAKAELI